MWHSQCTTSVRHVGIVLLAAVLLVFLMLSSVRSNPVQAATPPAHEPAVLGDPAELESFLDSQIGPQLRDNHIPGATMSVVKDGRVLLAKGYGACVLQPNRPVSAQSSLFQIGSVGKLITATAVMQLAEQRKLDLHADVNTYLKSFKIPATFPEPITLAHLLTHTAGFEDHITGSDAPTIDQLEPLDRWLAGHMPARVRAPGQLTAYSNYGFALAGYIVEQVSGLPFEQYLEQNLFQPLNMRSSTSRQPVPAMLARDLCRSYTYTGGGYQPNPFEVLNDVPAGAVTTTATDMAYFMLAHLQDGRLGTAQILQAATAQRMHAQQFTNDPRVPGETYGFEEEYLNGERLITHSGLTSSFFSLLALLPEQQVGLFFSFNSQGGIQAGPALLQAFMDRYYPAPEAALPGAPAGSAERISQITGDYWPTRRGYTNFEKLFGLFKSVRVADGGNGRLLISPFGSGPFEFVEVAPWVFRYVEGQPTALFRADPNGMLMLFDNDPAQATVRVPWYEGAVVQLGLIGVSTLLFISALVLWPIGFIRMAKRRVRDAQSRSGGVLPRAANWLVGTLCMVNVLVVIGLAFFGMGMGPYPVIFRGVPPVLTAVFVLALFSAVLTVGSVVCAIVAWWGRYWSMGRRLHYTLVALAALAFVLDLAYWNMLGFRV